MIIMKQLKNLQIYKQYIKSYDCLMNLILK